MIAIVNDHSFTGDVGGDDVLWLAVMGQIGLGLALLTIGARLIPAIVIQTLGTPPREAAVPPP
jgi:hypothetical protein